MPLESELFDAEFLGRLRSLFFKLRKRRMLQRKGAQATPAAGFTREFKDHRQYTPGDDFRSIDWRLYARLERMFIRIFEEVQEFHIHILVDTSTSMAEPHPEKRVAALRLAVALAYLGLAGQHRVSLLTFDTEPHRQLQPLKGQGHIHKVITHLSGLQFGGVTDLSTALGRLRIGRSKRGIVFLISDLLGRDLSQAVQAVEQAARWPAEVHVVQVCHPAELAPDLEGELRLVDVETGEIRRMWLNRRERDRLREDIDRFLESIEQACLQREVNYARWSTDRPFEELFVNLLARGSSLAGQG